MVERIPQHRHCHYCDKAIPFDKQYCNEECEDARKTVVRSKKRQLQLFYLLMVIIFVFAVLISFW